MQEGGTEPIPALEQAVLQLSKLRHNELRRRRGRGRSQVRRKIRQRKIDLVAHGGDHRQAAVMDRFDHDLLIEGPQILQRAAAPAHDQHVAPALLVRLADGGRDLLRRLLSLDRHGVEDDGHVGEPAGDHVSDVLDSRTGAGGHHPHRPGQEGDGLLQALVEPAPALKLVPECQKLLIQGPVPGLLHALGIDLEGAVPTVEPRPPLDADGHAVLGEKAEPQGVGPEHDAADGGGVILQGEIQVAGGVAFEGTDLPRYI